MKSYTVTALITTERTATVEANSQEEAWDIAHRLDEDDFDVNHDNTDYTWVIVSVEEDNT